MDRIEKANSNCLFSFIIFFCINSNKNLKKINFGCKYFLCIFFHKFYSFFSFFQKINNKTGIKTNHFSPVFLLITPEKLSFLCFLFKRILYASSIIVIVLVAIHIHIHIHILKLFYIEKPH